MRWPWSSDPTTSPGSKHDDEHRPLNPTGRKPVKWDDDLNAIDWAHFRQPSVIIPTILLTGTTLALIRAYKIYLRRIPNAGYIRPELFRKRSIFGRVTSVGDGDNFRLFHTPGGKWVGWGWLPGRKVPTKREELTGKTVHVRIAGVDAPELAHFGRPAQPYGQEALEFLTSFIGNRCVRAHIYRRDQYERVVGTVYMRKWGIFKKDVGLEMLQRGFATVYEAKFGAEFGDREEEYRAAEKMAREKGLGMWAKKGLLDKVFGRGKEESFESPREYKTRMAQMDREKESKVVVAKVVEEKKKPREGRKAAAK